jgi:hypothetical protein
MRRALSVDRIGERKKHFKHLDGHSSSSYYDDEDSGETS